MAKKIKALYLDENIYNKFRLYAIKHNSNVSELVEKFMKQTLGK